MSFLWVLALAFVLTTSVEGAAPIRICALPYKSNKHLLVTVDKDAKPTSEWVPIDDSFFIVEIASDFSSVNLKGSLKTRTGPDQDKTIQMDYTFSSNQKVDTCFCADETFTDKFGGTPMNPNYAATEKYCTRQSYNNEEINTKDLSFCPHCENRQCLKAERQGKAPDPIWQDWEFYADADGTLTGEGMPIFREAIAQAYPVINTSIHQCTPSLRNLPLAQMYCTNWENPTENEYGFGANSKNQRCGMSAWFNCEEDLEVLDENSRNPNGFAGHYADINLVFVPCSDIQCVDFRFRVTTDPLDPIFSAECEAKFANMVSKDCVIPPPFGLPSDFPTPAPFLP